MNICSAWLVTNWPKKWAPLFEVSRQAISHLSLSLSLSLSLKQKFTFSHTHACKQIDDWTGHYQICYLVSITGNYSRQLETPENHTHTHDYIRKYINIHTHIYIYLTINTHTHTHHIYIYITRFKI